ncbi:MAG: sigma 54-interacting transcriptional regulator [bacterium]|nr:sigma 54-interacting transcriptional regulator [bacterium]MBU1916713.1 sigma 54-interacting transcriptional regulator [bacterium]
MPELIVYQGDKKYFCIPIENNRLSIGRSSKNDLILTGNHVSRQHAAIEKRGLAYWIKDHSTAGTSLNGTKIEKPEPLGSEAEITIANWRLVYHANSQVLNTEKERRKTQITELTRALHEEPTLVLKLDSEARIFHHLKPCLIIDDVQAGKRSYHVKKNRLVIGSAANCDIVLQDTFVSKYHAEFRLSDFGFHVLDLDSTNGTFVKGSKIKECYVKENSSVTLGGSSIMICFDEESQSLVSPFPENNFCGIYGQSMAMRLLFDRIHKIAATDMTVLIQGETGTGKEMVARSIHDLSKRKNKPYVVINCGAISASLIESELFGHEKGAFTGADQKHIGAFEQANFGTLFLDEVGELPLDLQSKLLRVLEYQTFKRVGGNQDIKTNIRIITATHRDLLNMIERKEYREDLFYRLFVLPLKVPPLRERQEDIALLAKTFIDMCADGKMFYLEQATIDTLKHHAWPGNVRELKNTMLRTIAFAKKNHLSPDDIEFIHSQKNIEEEAINKMSKTQLDPEAKRRAEKEEIKKALNACNGDKTKAAQILGLGRSTLFRKVKEHDLEPNKPDK